MDEVKKIDLSNRIYNLCLILIIAIAISIVGGIFYNFASLPQNAPKEISFSGEGKVVVKPDIALVSFSVNTRAGTSVEAVNQNNTKMNAVIAAVKKAGVEDKDVQTTMYNLQPVYDYTREGSVFKGYSLDQQVSVKIRNLDNINSVMDSATSAGATTVGSLSFTVDDMEKVKSEARVKAIEQAKQKAKDLAGQSGLKLGKLVNVSEGYFGGYPTPLYGMGAANAMDKASSIAPSIQTGQSEVTVSISLTYQIN